jgi:hypothetical protein
MISGAPGDQKFGNLPPRSISHLRQPISLYFFGAMRDRRDTSSRNAQFLLTAYNQEKQKRIRPEKLMYEFGEYRVPD